MVGIAGLRLHFERVLKVGVALRRRISLASDVDGICLLFTFYYDEMRMDFLGRPGGKKTELEARERGGFCALFLSEALWCDSSFAVDGDVIELPAF